MKAHTLKLFLPLGLLLLAACDTAPVKSGAEIEVESLPGTAAVTEQQISLSEQADRLLILAESSRSAAEQQGYRLRAARLYIEAGRIPAAKKQLDILRESATDQTATTTALILAAEIAIAEKDEASAVELVAAITPLTRSQQIEFYALKADLDYLSGRYLFAVDRRIQLDAHIDDERDKYRNNKKIWAALSAMTSAQLKKQTSTNAAVKSWLELAKVMRSAQKQPAQLEDAILDWLTEHPQHTVSQTFLDELLAYYAQQAASRKHIAVLLPMQGDLATISDAIKNGLLSAHYNDDAASSLKPVIHFYDTSDKDIAFYKLYRQAIDDGATNVIGPLDKVVINQLAQQKQLEIPVLTLNYAENPLSQTENLYQFGLSPEDEARQAAELAIRQNKKRAAVFYPDSDWGRRLNTVFTEHYQSLGGSVMTDAGYAPSANDYTRPIRQLFNLEQSDIRHRKLENTIGEKAQNVSRRRQDIDMIFLAATHRSARGIMPAFKFHHAGDLPVYATSHIYTGKVNRELDRDLNGLIFCDLPWILQNDSALEKVFNTNWPQQQSLTRLFALGVDAYHLLYNLDYLQNREYASFAGETGDIQLDAQNRITRKLLWAKFENGRPVYFEPVFDTAQNQTIDN